MNTTGKYLKDESGNTISPITSASTVFDENGTDLQTYMNTCKSSFMFTYHSDNYYVDAQGTPDLWLDLYQSYGDGFTKGGNSIICNKTGYVVVSAQVIWASNTPGNNLQSKILHNGNEVSRAYNREYYEQTFSQIHSPIVLTVYKDDTIQLRACNWSATPRYLTGGDCTNTRLLAFYLV